MSLCRCSRCENLYYAGNPDQQCRYHSGHFRMWWSCCKEPLASAAGCRQGAHTEDVGYTAMLDSYAAPCGIAHNDSFEVTDDTDRFVIQGPNGEISFAEVVVSQSPSPDQQGTTAVMPASASATAAAEPSAPREGAEEEDTQPRDESDAAAGGSGSRTVPVPYVVSPHDTFSSICLKHRMSPFELCRLNGLAPTNRRARVGDVLLVWAERSDAEMSEDLHRMLVRQFRRLTGCSAAEALYYLEGHEYQIGDAIRTRTHDHAWERERAVVVNLILDEEEQARQAAATKAAEEAEAEAELARQAEKVTQLRERIARHEEATRALSACLRPALPCVPQAVPAA